MARLPSLEPIDHDDTNANRVHRAAVGVRDGIPGGDHWTSADVRHVAGQCRRQRARRGMDVDFDHVTGAPRRCVSWMRRRLGRRWA